MLGFLLGMLHATDADHLAAVSTIVSRQRSVGGAARVGLLWGLGHSVTVLGVGVAIIVFNLALPPRLESALEFGVALMLIALGVATLARASRQLRDTVAAALAAGWSAHSHLEPVDAAHAHLHTHGGFVHAHGHGHLGAGHGHAGTAPTWLQRLAGGLSLVQALRPLSIGIVHGLAGSAAVALLVLAQIREPLWALPYLLLFGLGSTAGMMLITSAIALPLLRANRLPVLGLGLQIAAGALSLGLGAWLAWQLGVAGGLFVAPPSA